MKLKQYLNQRFIPNTTAKWKWFNVLGVGIFIFIFLFVFKPSPYIYNLEILNQFFMSLGFGAITSIIIYVFKFLIEPTVINEKWTLGKSILWGILISACIGITSYCYIVILFENTFTIESLPIHLKYFFLSIFSAVLVGIIPITIHHLINYIYVYKKLLTRAGLVKNNQIILDDEITIKAGKDSNSFVFRTNTIIYIASEDNYITVYTLENKTIKNTLIRGTLKSVESELIQKSQFLRCHKSYIINLSFFDEFSGNSQNLKVVSSKTKVELPVSRTKAKLLKELINLSKK